MEPRNRVERDLAQPHPTEAAVQIDVAPTASPLIVVFGAVGISELLPIGGSPDEQVVAHRARLGDEHLFVAGECIVGRIALQVRDDIHLGRRDVAGRPGSGAIRQLSQGATPAHHGPGPNFRKSTAGHEPRRSVAGAIRNPVAGAVECRCRVGDEGLEASKLALEDLYGRAVGAVRRIRFDQSVDCFGEDSEIHADSQSTGCNSTTGNDTQRSEETTGVVRVDVTPACDHCNDRTAERRGPWPCVRLATQRCWTA